MSISLDQIITNPELAKSVSTEWIQGELQKQPYNRFLQGLLEERSQTNTGFSYSDPQSLIDSIISDEKPSNSGSYFIRDIELSAENTFAEADTSVKKEAIITGAAIGTGAMMAKGLAGSKPDASELIKQPEEKGLLGFLNRLDGTVTPKASTPELDPMLKKENYEKADAEDLEYLDVTDEITKKVDDVEDEIELESNEITEIQEQIPTLETNQNIEEEEDYPDQMVFVDNVDSKKKKKSKKSKFNYRWSSQTEADYTMSGLDPFTVWINNIDGVEMTAVESKQEGKKKKKKKKKNKAQSKSLESKPEIASEALAGLLTNQGHYEDAIAMYEQLSLKNPEKSSFFAAKIESIKDKI